MRGDQFDYLLEKKKYQHVSFIFMSKPHKVISQIKAAIESKIYFLSFFGPRSKSVNIVFPHKEVR
jgi:hypothetical protein